MPQSPVVCPACGKTNGIYKVSHIYLAAVAEQQKKDGASSIAPDLTGLNFPRGFAARAFIQKFAPPSGSAERLRTIHPDWTAAALALMSLFIVYQIFLQQPGFGFYAVGITLVTFGFYFFFRRRLIDRFTQTIEETAAQKAHVEKAVEMWISLYYCTSEDLIFDPHTQKNAPSDELQFLIAELLEAAN